MTTPDIGRRVAEARAWLDRHCDRDGFPTNATECAGFYALTRSPEYVAEVARLVKNYGEAEWELGANDDPRLINTHARVQVEVDSARAALLEFLGVKP
jgi:hypothetical protein